MRKESHIMISVEKRFVDRFLSGDKTVELRRKPIRISSGTQVWIYSKAPSARIELVATVDAVHEGTTQKIWREYGGCAAITKKEFEAYYSGTKLAYAMLLKDFRCLSPALGLDDAREKFNGFHPPQFFKYLRAEGPELAVLQTAVA